MRMSRFDWSVHVVKTHVCNVIRFERTRNDNSRTLHVLDEVLRVACMLVHVVYTVVENLNVVTTIWRPGSTQKNFRRKANSLFRCKNTK